MAAGTSDLPGAAVPDVSIEIPPAAEFVGLVRHVIGATARLGGLSPDSVENAKLVASEACTNAVTMSSRVGRSDPPGRGTHDARRGGEKIEHDPHGGERSI